MINKLWKKQIKFYENYRDNILKLEWGGLDKYGYKAIKKLLSKVLKKDITVVEVGCWIGTVSVLLRKLIEEYNGILFSIDTFKGSENSNLVSPEYINIEKIFRKNIEKASTNIHLIKGYSKEVSKRFKSNSIDFVFIDADHRYRFVKEDIKAWLPKVKKGGIICGHDCECLIKNLKDLYIKNEDVDYFQGHLGVIRAVCELLPKAKVTKKGYIWYYQK